MASPQIYYKPESSRWAGWPAKVKPSPFLPVSKLLAHPHPPRQIHVEVENNAQAMKHYYAWLRARLWTVNRMTVTHSHMRSYEHSLVPDALRTFPRAATPSCPVSEERWAKVFEWHYPLDSSSAVDYAMWAERVPSMRTFPSHTNDCGWLPPFAAGNDVL